MGVSPPPSGLQGYGVMVALWSPKPPVHVRVVVPLLKKLNIMNKTATLTENGFWCPHCGEWISRDELDCDDIYDIEHHGDSYYECPKCGEGFFVDECADHE